MADLFFETNIINSRLHQRLQPVRYGLYILLIMIVMVVYYVFTEIGFYEEWALLLIKILAIVFVLASFSVIGMYLHSKKPKLLGTLTIDKEQLIISSEIKHISGQYDILDTGNSIKGYPLKKIQNLEIKRRATYHYAYKEDNYLNKMNNLISFEYEGVQQKFEFSIESPVANKKFETMVAFLRLNVQGTKYFSV